MKNRFQSRSLKKFGYAMTHQSPSFLRSYQKKERIFHSHPSKKKYPSAVLVRKCIGTKTAQALKEIIDANAILIFTAIFCSPWLEFSTVTKAKNVILVHCPKPLEYRYKFIQIAEINYAHCRQNIFRCMSMSIIQSNVGSF